MAEILSPSAPQDSSNCKLIKDSRCDARWCLGDRIGLCHSCMHETVCRFPALTSLMPANSGSWNIFTQPSFDLLFDHAVMDEKQRLDAKEQRLDEEKKLLDAKEKLLLDGNIPQTDLRWPSLIAERNALTEQYRALAAQRQQLGEEVVKCCSLILCRFLPSHGPL